MSTTVDSRVVEMRFDNQHFERNVQTSMSTLDMLKEKAEGMNINLYADYDEMLEKESPDLVDVSTPTYLHKDYAIKALKKGINVICEKPMAVNGEDAKEIIEAANESGKLFMAAHVVRFMRAYV